MADDRKRKRSCSQDGLAHEQERSSRQPRLLAKITEIIENNRPPDPETLIENFLQDIWPKVRDDYDQMTQYLKENLQTALKERRVEAEVFSRVKDDRSIKKTLRRRQKGLHHGSGLNSYQDIFHEMHDLSGLRIVLENPDDLHEVQRLIEETFKQQKPTVHFDPDREVGHFWRKPWFGAYETNNHRVQLTNDNRTCAGEGNEFSGIMFEIQLTTFADNLHNKLAHDLLYKADPGFLTGQEEMVIDLSKGLGKCFQLCMRILQPKRHRNADNGRVGAAEDVGELTEEKVNLAREVAEDFKRDLEKRSSSDPVAEPLRRLLRMNESAEDQACLRDLLVSDPRDDKMRIEETKGGLFSLSYNWILQDDDFRRWRNDGQNQPFWITGHPGKGKTMMLCGIIDELEKMSGTNVSYFFCQATDNRINTGTAVLRGLLFLLCKQQHPLISHVRQRYDDAGEKLFQGPNAWVALSQILDNIIKDSGLRKTYLIVDALDECLPESRKLLVELIIRISNARPTVKWIVSSRRGEVSPNLGQVTHLSLESREASVSATVNAYIDFKAAKLEERLLSHSVAQKVAIELKMKSEGTFLWVAIVCKELEELEVLDESEEPDDLEDLESAQEFEVMKLLQEMPSDLDELYGKLIQDIKSSKRANQEHCQSVLRAVAVAFRPLTLKEIQQLTDPPKGVGGAVPKMCRSLLTIRDGSVFFVHQSAKDHLTRKWDTIFETSMRNTHESMVLRSIEAMTSTLQQDMYDLRHSGISIEDIQLLSPDPLVPIAYSCIYWVTHLLQAQPCSTTDHVDGFLRVHFLHWFEALSLMRNASACVYALRDLVTLANNEPRFKPLLPLAYDMYRFAQSHRAIISQTPLQAYSSALIFSPACSLTRRLFTSKEPKWIVQKPRVEQHWDSCLKTLTGHLDLVSSMDFSPDGHSIVSGSSDGTIKIWDAESGVEAFSLQGHTHWVRSVAFDKTGNFIISKSDDATVKRWHVETGTCLSTSEGPMERTEKFAVSPDRLRHADCISLDGALHIIDSGSNNEVLTLRGHSKPVRSVAFSRNNRLIASGSDDESVKIWDAETGAEKSTLLGYNGRVWSVCFSHDVRRIASGSEDGTIRIWDIQSAEVPSLQSHYGHRDGVSSVALTIDGSHTASTSGDRTVKIWDAESGDNTQTFEYEHVSGIKWLTFSPNGRHIAATPGNGNSVLISDIESGVTTSIQGLPCHPYIVASWDSRVALSLDGRYIAAAWHDDLKTKEAGDAKNILTLEGHSGRITSFTFSPKYSHIVASASSDKTIKLWNVEIGAEIATLHLGDEGDEVYLSAFDTTGAFLYTQSTLPSYISTWSVNSTMSHTGFVLPQLLQNEYGVNEDCSWITWHGQNIIWLPPDYRETPGVRNEVRGVLRHMISIGCPSGRVWWLKFSSQHQFIAT